MKNVKFLVIFCISLLPYLSYCQEIEDIRLANGTYGDFMGRVELLVNGTWGTVCNDNWAYLEARTACRMLGLTSVACVAHGPAFDNADGSVPVIMRAIDCLGSEYDLNECDFELAEVNETCRSGAGAGAVCVQLPRKIGAPTDVTQLDATSTTVTIGFQLPPIPLDGVTRFRFRVQQVNGDFGFCYAENDGTTVFNCTLSGLSPSSTYRVFVRVDVVYSVCSRAGYLWGNFSRFIRARTSARPAPPPSVPFRLVPPRADATFMGRLEVMYNNTWGTVCDDAFQNPEANVACQTLGYPRAMCYAREGRFGQGTGPIWMDNLDCTRSHDTLLECDFNGWGVNNCDHGDDIGVVCWPDQYNIPVSGVSVIDTTGSSITITWEPFAFPPLTSDAGYDINYFDGSSASNINIGYSETQYTIRGLRTNVTYLIRVRARFHYSEYCISRTFRRTQWSTPRIRVTTVDTAPSAPPTSFHIVVLNSTAIEFQWELPPTEFQNGIIRGYRLFIREQGSNMERTTDVPDGQANEFIVAGLTAGTAYVCSMLAYTSADGPRTLFLTASTYQTDFTPFVIYFGINGNGLDRATKQLDSEEDISIHCDAGISNVTTNWYFSDGTPVGTTDRNVRQASYPNGTTILQIANGRALDYCDAGVYTCQAVSSTGEAQERDFKLLVDYAPPTPGIAYAQSIGSTWITIAWRDLECDGGHKVVGQNIRYGKDFANFILPSNFFIYNINASLRQYTIQNLEPSTSYNISIQAVSADFRMSDYSEGNVITTLPDAPSPPRSVRARLVSAQQSLVEVSWREPAATNGIISQYTMSVRGSTSPNTGSDGIAINQVEAFNKTYPGHIGAANITVSNTEVTYTFQVRASNLVNGIQNHGEFSEVTPESTLFVPSLNLPIPQNVRIADSTNSTITLRWDYPPPPSVPVYGFQVAYSARIEWVSPQQTLVMFNENGVTITSTNSSIFSQLTPATTYRFRVSAITQNEERGAEMVISGTTAEATGERLAYVQLRISPVASCYFWQERSAERISFIRNSLLTQLNDSLCPSCYLSNKTITDEELSCREQADQVVFRARIIGNSQYSASGLVDLLQSWVASGTASISVNSVRYHIDPTCLIELDSLAAPDCAIAMTTTTSASPTTPTSPPTMPSSPPTTASSPPTTPPSSPTTRSSPPEVSLGSQTGISSGEIGGLIIGVIIAAFLLLFIALVALLICRTFRGTYGTKPMVDDHGSSVVFSDIIKDTEDDIDTKADLGNSNGDTTGL